MLKLIVYQRKCFNDLQTCLVSSYQQYQQLLQPFLRLFLKLISQDCNLHHLIQLLLYIESMQQHKSISDSIVLQQNFVDQIQVICDKPNYLYIINQRQVSIRMQNTKPNNQDHETDQYYNLLKKSTFVTKNVLEMQMKQIIRFFENMDKRILFLFGPSGCGKTQLVTGLLEYNQIQHQWAYEYAYQKEEGQFFQQTFIQMMERYFRGKMQREQKVFLFHHFPIIHDEMNSKLLAQVRHFRLNAYKILENVKWNRNKYVFILNSQIYNPFYILNQGSSLSCLSKLKNISVMKMKAYTQTKMKIIINNVISNNYEYAFLKDKNANMVENATLIDNIIALSSGDARKAKNLMFLKKTQNLAKYAPKIAKQEYEVQFYDQDGNLIKKKPQIKKFGFGNFFQTSIKAEKDEPQLQKLDIFHTLGKFLYGKRYNINFDQYKKQGKNNQISRYYTKQQLEKYDPKFYFKPFQLFQKSHIPFNTFLDLLTHNFLNRYGNLTDVRKMYEIFRFCDDKNAEYIRFDSKEEMDELKQYLVTWGIILNNQHSQLGSKSYLIEKSRTAIIDKTLGQKRQLLKQFYSRHKIEEFTIKYKLSDMMYYAHTLKNVVRYMKFDTKFFQHQLVNIVFWRPRGNGLHLNVPQQRMKIQQQQDDEAFNQANQSLIKIKLAIQNEIAKRIKHQEMVQYMLDSSSDIDSDPQV